MRRESEKRELSRKINIGIILIIVFIFTGVTNMSAAGFLGFGDTASWKEEVLLHDGSKIIVERWQKHGGRHEPGQQPGISDQSIAFTIPGSKKTITWKDEYSEELGRCNFTLLALHILNEMPYIITKPRLCLSYNKWGRPNPPYVIFKYENKEWKRIEITELPVEFKNINLVITSGGDEKKLVAQDLVYVEMVQELNSDKNMLRNHEEYKTIIRTPLKPGSLGVSCPDWSLPQYTSPKSPISITPKEKGKESK
ncbi:MAG: hypothetical protein JW976_14200 [Syntrophaceae bacterium]|nr:hypothetical protein [Syntrophaceae bacterium]